MSKKFGKFLLFSAVAGAAAYGAYQYLQNKDKTVSAKSTEDADDDFDDFTEDLDDEPTPAKERSYVALNLDKAEALASEAFHKAKEVITDSVMQVRETVKSVAEAQSSQETNFTDLTAIQKEAASHKESDAEAAEPAQDEEPPKANAAAWETDNAAAESEAATEPFTASNTASEEASSETVEEFFDDSTL